MKRVESILDSNLSSLSAEQREQAKGEILKEWEDWFYKFERIDKEAFERGIEWVYTEILNLEKPQIYYCESWLDCMVKISLKLPSTRDKIRKVLIDCAEGRTRIPTDKVETVNEIYFEKSWLQEIMDEHSNGTYNIEDIYDEVYEDLKAIVVNSMTDLKNSAIYNSYSFYISTYNRLKGVAAADFALKSGDSKDETLAKYVDLIRSGVFQSYEYEEYVFAIQPPTHIDTIAMEDGDTRIHSTDRKAIEWADGFGLYYLEGTMMPTEKVEKIERNEFTAKEFFEIRNEEVKSNIIRWIQTVHGDEAVYQLFKEVMSKVDEYVDKKDSKFLEGTTNSTNIGVYTLFKGNIDEFEIAYVRCYCPSTDRMFFLGVDPTHTKAADAIASLCPIPSMLIDKVQYIQRQGEKFSIVFDEETTQKLEKGEIPRDELLEYTYPSGEFYFSKMRYEY